MLLTMSYIYLYQAMCCYMGGGGGEEGVQSQILKKIE